MPKVFLYYCLTECVEMGKPKSLRILRNIILCRSECPLLWDCERTEGAKVPMITGQKLVAESMTYSSLLDTGKMIPESGFLFTAVEE